jgi:CBS domain-containing protein
VNIANIMTARPLTVAPTASIDRAINLMEENDVHHLCVVNGQRLVGMISDRDILISTGWMLAVERQELRTSGTNGREVKRVSQIMSIPALVLEETDDVRDAANLMMTHQISAVPILSGTRLAGIVTDTDLMCCLDDTVAEGNAAWRFLNSAVRTLMTTPVITAVPAAELDEVVDNFRRFRIRHVPVATDRKLLGMISDRDVRRLLGWSAACDRQDEAQARLGTLRTPQTASEIMQNNVRTIGSSSSLRDALHHMRAARVHSLPVVDDGSLIGIITQTDFVEALSQNALCD